MKIADTEIYEITLTFNVYIAYPLQHYHTPTRRTIHVTYTNIKLIGLGEASGRVEPKKVTDNISAAKPSSVLALPYVI